MTSYNIVHDIPYEIFRAYDIRGIVGETFTANNIYTIGLAIGSEVLEQGYKVVAVGRDGRLSGPQLVEALISGITASGCNVVNVGEVTTPVLYYAATTIESQSGIMLTGSHNPPNYNGIKMVVGGQTLFGDAVQKLYKRIVEGKVLHGTGTVKPLAIIESYWQVIQENIKLLRPLKVVVDAGNGVGGKIAPQLLSLLGCKVIELYCEVDGNFPNHHPDPSVPENLLELQAAVKKHKADVGLAFDGDADRVGIVTERGEIIAADRLLMLFAIDFLSRHPGMIIPFDVKCTRHLAVQIAKHGGVPLMYKTGHSLLKSKLQSLGDKSLLAGELSGHIFIKERWFGFDDGIYVATRVLEILARNEKTCGELFDALPDSVNTPELKLAIPEAQKFQFMDKFVKNAKFPGGEVNLIDGIRVDYPYGFGLVRPSNTSPYLILRFEGDTAEDLQRIKQTFKEEFLKLDKTLKLPT